MSPATAAKSLSWIFNIVPMLRLRVQYSKQYSHSNPQPFDCEAHNFRTDLCAMSPKYLPMCLLVVQFSNYVVMEKSLTCRASAHFRCSVTRLGDVLDFGQIFRAFCNNYFAQISHILRQFLQRCQNL